MAIRILEAVVAAIFPLTCALKGKWGLLILGFAAPALWVIGAARHAKPTSRWARLIA